MHDNWHLLLSGLHESAACTWCPCVPDMQPDADDDGGEGEESAPEAQHGACLVPGVHGGGSMGQQECDADMGGDAASPSTSGRHATHDRQHQQHGSRQRGRGRGRGRGGGGQGRGAALRALYAAQLMTPEWLTDIPPDLATHWCVHAAAAAWMHGLTLGSVCDGMSLIQSSME